MKGAGWEATGCLDVQQAKKAGDIVSEVGLTFDPLNEKKLISPGHLGNHTQFTLTLIEHRTVSAHRPQNKGLMTVRFDLIKEWKVHVVT